MIRSSSGSNAWVHLVVASVVLVGCGVRSELPAPQAIEPSWAFNGERTPVLIRGEGFIPSIVVPAGAGAAGTNPEFAVALVQGTTRLFLDGVTWRDKHTLMATVPEMLPLGRYGVEVSTPDAGAGLLPDAFEIRDTRVGSINLQADALTHPVDELAILTLSLLDPSAQSVTQDLEVTLTASTPEGDPPDISMTSSGMHPDVTGVFEQFTARMGVDGTATVAVRGRKPGIVNFSVVASDLDTRIAGDQLQLEFVRGQTLVADVGLPSADFVAVAGEPFAVDVVLRDPYGNPAPDAHVTLTLQDACVSYLASGDIFGSGSVQTEVRVATLPGSGCEVQRILAISPTLGLLGTSADFAVKPGPRAQLKVEARPASVRAGQPLSVFITPVDAWGNVRSDTYTVAAIEDAGQPTSFSCADPTFCTVQLTQAGTGHQLTVRDSTGVEGLSQPDLHVTPADPAKLVLSSVQQVWEAGQPQSIAVVVTDAWDNTIDPTLLDFSGLQLSASVGPVSCGAYETLAQSVRCTLMQASAQVTLTAALAWSMGHVAQGSLAPVQVVNGPLAGVSLTPSTTQPVAGESWTLSAVAKDAWGNPWIVRDHATLAIDDDQGTLQPKVLTFDQGGVAQTNAILTRAGPTRISVHDQGEERGRSGVITVSAAQTSGFVVGLEQPWAYLHEALAVRVEAVDAWANHTLVSGPATLSTDSGFAPASAINLVNGIGSGSLLWSQAILQDTVLVQMGSLSGEVDVLVVRSCNVNPSTRIDTGPEGYGRSCLDERTGVSTLGFDLTASSPVSAHQLVAFGGQVEGGQGSVSTQPVLSLQAGAAGIYNVRALTVQEDACASEDSVRWYVGAGPGQPAGPILIQPAVASLPIGTTASQTSVQLSGVIDCHGAPVAAGVRVRSDLGRLTGVQPTGQGLEVVSNRSGNATFGLDASEVLQGGFATIEVGGGQEPVEGVSSLFLVGDLQRPVVWSQDPRGGLDASVDRVRVTFSEAINPSTISLSTVSLQGVGPQIASLSLSGQQRVLDVLLSSPASPGLGPWRLVLGPGITDTAGNPLSGDWSGGASAYEGPFGGPSAVDPVDVCTADRAQFRPDGDDAPGEESDAVRVDFRAQSAPAWWVVDVSPAGSTDRLLRTWLVPQDREDFWSWDGRDQSGRVVAPGNYQIRIRTEGSEGQSSPACSVIVGVKG